MCRVLQGRRTDSCSVHDTSATSGRTSWRQRTAHPVTASSTLHMRPSFHTMMRCGTAQPLQRSPSSPSLGGPPPSLTSAIPHTHTHTHPHRGCVKGQGGEKCESVMSHQWWPTATPTETNGQKPIETNPSQIKRSEVLNTHLF